MNYRHIVAVFLCFPALLLAVGSCRSGVYDPELVLTYLDPPASYPLDELQDARPPAGTGMLVAGAAAVDISPYNYRVWISGFGAGRISRGVRDPVFARALFIDDGHSSLVLVSLDLTGLLKPDIDRIRALVSERYRDRILIASTHNHQAPDTIGYWGFGLGIPLENGVVDEYQNEMIHKTAECINRAIQNARPARFRFGNIDIPEGYAGNLWFPDDPTSHDSEMGVIRVEGSDGNAVAILANWACHAEAQLGKGHLISAEFPGNFYTEVERLSGGVGIFFNGALGGMVIPYPNHWHLRREYDFQDRLEFNAELGRVLAEKAEEAVANGLPFGYGEVQIRLARRDVEIPVEGFLFTMLGRMGVIRDADRVTAEDRLLTTEVYAVGLGPATIVTVPGEIFPVIGFEIKEQIYAPFRFVFGLASDELGYMMNPDQFDDDTYRYERRVSLGRMTGAVVRDAVLEVLFELQEVDPVVLGGPS